jgi:hypothetical protein
MRVNKLYEESNIEINDSVEGETIEEKIRRILDSKEPISEGADVIYTERKDGVNPAYDVRTDRFELAVDAMDKVHKDRLAKREERHNPLKKVDDISKDDLGKAEPKV